MPRTAPLLSLSTDTLRSSRRSGGFSGVGLGRDNFSPPENILWPVLSGGLSVLGGD